MSSKNPVFFGAGSLCRTNPPVRSSSADDERSVGTVRHPSCLQYRTEPVKRSTTKATVPCCVTVYRPPQRNAASARIAVPDMIFQPVGIVSPGYFEQSTREEANYPYKVCYKPTSGLLLVKFVVSKYIFVVQTPPNKHCGVMMAKKAKKIAPREYTKADVKELRAHSKAKTPITKIAKLTKRTVGSLRQKARRLGVPLGHRR